MWGEGLPFQASKATMAVRVRPLDELFVSLSS